MMRISSVEISKLVVFADSRDQCLSYNWSYQTYILLWQYGPLVFEIIHHDDRFPVFFRAAPESGWIG